jgi:hypothetical protein
MNEVPGSSRRPLPSGSSYFGRKQGSWWAVHEAALRKYPAIADRQKAQVWRWLAASESALQGAPQHGGKFATQVNAEPPLAIRTRSYLGTGTIGEEPAAGFLDRPLALAKSRNAMSREF